MDPLHTGHRAEQLLRARAKDVLRGRMKSVRRVLTVEACAERSANLCARLLELPELASARTVLGFRAFRKEPDPSGALRLLAANGACMALPRVDTTQDVPTLTLHAYVEGEPLEESAWGILEPLSTAERIADETIDAVLVPALCIDAAGYRVGYGKGFYDRLLPRLPRALCIGVCYDHELLGELPNTDGDARVRWIVTDARVLRAEER
jgi:5-formyltetrahydrofolate cyclo-ligase